MEPFAIVRCSIKVINKTLPLKIVKQKRLHYDLVAASTSNKNANNIKRIKINCNDWN